MEASRNYVEPMPLLRALPADLAMLVARIFLASPFIVFGTLKYINMGKMMSVIEQGGLPGWIIWVVIPFQIITGICVATGLATRLAAFLLAGFCILATCLYHNRWSDLSELSNFTKDFAQAGGFIYLMLYGAGKYSLDAQRAGRRI